MCYRDGVAGKALSKKRLARWLCECISQAYRQAGRDPPTVVCAHSPVSIALFSGASVEDVCTAASWSMPCLFIQFYLLDINGSFSGSVLAGAIQDL